MWHARRNNLVVKGLITRWKHTECDMTDMIQRNSRDYHLLLENKVSVVAADQELATLLRSR